MGLLVLVFLVAPTGNIWPDKGGRVQCVGPMTCAWANVWSKDALGDVWLCGLAH